MTRRVRERQTHGESGLSVHSHEDCPSQVLEVRAKKTTPQAVRVTGEGESEG